MGNCATCNVELVGTPRFCTACGAPVKAAGGAPSNVAASPPAPAPTLSVPSATEDVNPFAATASPTSAAAIAAREHLAAALAKTADAAGPSDRPSEAPPISPLAVSNALSQRGAFQQIIDRAAEKEAAASVAPPKKKPGTQIMQNRPPLPPPRAAGGEASRPAPKPRTVAMSIGSRPTPSPGNTPAPQSVPPGSVPGPPASLQRFTAGARVQVAWSNGQRYAATVVQVNGPVCLVAFPDGQQRWVELQYLSPA